MTREAIFALALALPGTEPGTSYGHACVKLRGKAILGDCREPGAVALHLDPETVERLVETDPDAFYQTPHFVGWPTILVRPTAADPQWLAALVEQAWGRRATKVQRLALERMRG